MAEAVKSISYNIPGGDSDTKPRTWRVLGERHVMLGAGRPDSRSEEKACVSWGSGWGEAAICWVQDWVGCEQNEVLWVWVMLVVGEGMCGGAYRRKAVLDWVQEVRARPWSRSSQRA